MKLSYNSGINIESDEFKLMLDASRKVKDSLIGVSHAHSDHVKKHTGNILSTIPTKDFFPFEPTQHTPLEYNKKIKFDDVEIKLKCANHILGSAQFEISNSTTIGYTGDFRVRKSIFFPECDIIDADTLVIETTYGNPKYTFPEYESVVQDIQSWTTKNSGSNIIYGAYSLGKSQEIIKILNQEGITPVIHSKIADNSKIYKDNKIKLDYLDSNSEEAIEVMKDPFVGIVAPHLMKKYLSETFSFQNRKNTLTSLVTGWRYRTGANRNFCLSDHADYHQLIEYVERANPKRVFTVHGFEKVFAKEVSKKFGIPAKPLKSKQALISDY